MNQNDVRSKSYTLIQMLGSPLSKDGPTIPLYESEELFECAFINRIGLFYLDSLFKAGKITKFKEKYEQLCEREKETFITADRVSKVLKDASVPHAVIKTLRPYPATPNDVDVVCLGDNLSYERGEKSLEDRQYLLIHRKQQQNGYCDPRGRFLRIEERGVHDKFAGGKYFIDWYRNLAADNFHYLEKGFLVDSVVNYSPVQGVEFLTLEPMADLVAILMHSVFPHQNYGIESFYTTTFWLAGADIREINGFLELIKKQKMRSAASIYLSVTLQIHKEIFGIVPEKLKELALSVGISKYEINSFKSSNRELPYVFSFINIMLVLLQKMQDFNALKSMLVQFAEMIKPSFFLNVLNTFKEKRIPQGNEGYRQL